MEKRDDDLKENTKKLSIIEGSFYGIHEGVGIRYIAPFALAIGKGNPYVTTFLAILHSVPSLIGNLSQLYTNKIINKYKRKYLLAFFVILQSLAWFSILLSGLFFLKFNDKSSLSLILLVISYTLLVSFGSFINPVWTSLMKDIVSDKNGYYFGRRTMISGFVALLSSLLAGIFLDKLSPNKLLMGFFLLFFFAFIFRLFSGILFFFHYDPPFKKIGSDYFSFIEFVREYRTSNFVKFSLFISFFMFSVSLASPFFIVYMLEDLKFSYLTWTIISVAGSLSSLIFMSFWGNFIDNHGSIKTIRLTGVVISLIPAAWIFTYYMNPESLTIFIYLIILELFAGFMWAGFNLSYSNFVYDVIVKKEKTHLCAAYFNVLHAIGIFLGAVIGSLIISFNINLFFVSSIFFIFFLSALSRILAYLIMTPRINEVRNVQNATVEKAFKELCKFHMKPFIHFFHLKINKLNHNG